MDGGTCVGASENNTSNARRAVYVLLPTSISSVSPLSRLNAPPTFEPSSVCPARCSIVDDMFGAN